MTHTPRKRLMPLLLRRSMGVVGLLVLSVALLGFLRMHHDIDDEARGIHDLGQLLEVLQGLQTLSDAEAVHQLAAMGGKSTLRHVGVVVRDAEGTERWRSGPVEATAAGSLPTDGPIAGRWPIPRPHGLPWEVLLLSTGEAERTEALQDLALGVAGLLALALGVFLATYHGLRHAFLPLQTLVAAIETAGRESWSDLRRLPAMPVHELESIAVALRHLAHSLEEAQARRQSLSDRLLGLQEEERAHLARELHDEWGQQLTSLRVNAHWLLHRLEASSPLRPVVERVATQVEDLQVDMRSLLLRLRPFAFGGAEGATLSLGRWVEAVRHLVQSWNATSAGGCQITLEVQGLQDDLLLPEPIALSMYRMTQEALTNTMRHAQASACIVTLAPGSVPRTVRWRVADDGRGWGTAAEAPWTTLQGNGLVGMRERAWSCGAELRALATDRITQRGALLEAVFPI